MGRPKSTLKGLLEWRAQGREIHAAMMAMLGVGFPESQLTTVVDGLLQVGGEGQAKAWALASRRTEQSKGHPTPPTKKKYEVKGKGKRPEKRGGIVNAVRKSLDTSPRTSNDILGRGRKLIPGLGTDQVSKCLASMYLREEIKRKGDTKPFQYFV
jgi:hypothetical protein